jgi:hypothetical protein
LGILERKYEGKENEIFIWMDIFSVKQPPNLTDPGWFQKGLHDLIGNCKQGRVVIFDNWKEPRPMLRSWCVWEIFGAAKMNKSLDIIMTRKQEKSFVDGISNDFGTVLNILKIIDTQKAKAF